MKSNHRYRKFQLHQKNIEALEKENSRFRRVFSEYEILAEELWKLENEAESGVPDAYIEAMLMQSAYLEDEIQDWLGKNNCSTAENDA